MTSNQQAGLRFRRELVEYLKSEGLSVTNSIGRVRSDLIGPSVYTDIDGLEPWVIEAKATKYGDPSAALASARDAAQLSGSEWYCAIIGRHGRRIADSYAVLPLHILARLFAGATPTLLPASGGESNRGH